MRDKGSSDILKLHFQNEVLTRTMPKAPINYIADPRTESFVSEETGEVLSARDHWQVHSHPLIKNKNFDNPNSPIFQNSPELAS